MTKYLAATLAALAALTVPAAANAQDAAAPTSVPTTLPSGTPEVPDAGPAPDADGEGDADVISTDDPFGLPGTDPLDGGRPIGDPGVEVVQRWTITPQGSNDPNAVSTRAELSYTGEPGSTIDDGVTVFNLGNDVMTFHVYATDARNDPSGAFTLLSGDVEPSDVGTWVEIGQEHVTVAPGMAATIPITIRIPEDASPGDHTGGVVASSTTLGTTDDGSVLNVDRSVGTRLYLRVAGPLRPELAVESLSVSYDGGLNPFGGTATVRYRIQNRGNVRMSGSYASSVAGPFGMGRASNPAVDFPELLPGQGIDVTETFDGVPALGFVRADVEVTPNGGDSVAAGTTEGSTRSLALPISVLLILVALLAAWFGTRRFRRHRHADVELVEVDERETVSAGR